MEKEIAELIRKNLPAEVGDLLRQELTALSSLRERHSQLEKLYNDQHQEVVELKHRAIDVTTLDARAAALTQRENVVAQQERNLTCTMLELKVAEAEKRAVCVTDLVATLFRGPLVTRTMTGTAAGGIGQGYSGGPSVAHTVPVSSTEQIQG